MSLVMVDSGPEPAGAVRTAGVVSPNCGDVTCGSSAALGNALEHHVGTRPVSNGPLQLRVASSAGPSESGIFNLCANMQPQHAAASAWPVSLAGGLWLSTSEHPRALIPNLDADRGAGQIAIAGRGRAIDGDTLVVGGVRVRLEGIDAPEAAQTCGGAGSSSWACGTAALDALEQLVAGQHVSCAGSGYDSYGRLLALCAAAGRELNAEMVRSGLAWAFVRYSQRYAALETEARSRLVGVWRDRAEPPWSFRAKH